MLRQGTSISCDEKETMQQTGKPADPLFFCYLCCKSVQWQKGNSCGGWHYAVVVPLLSLLLFHRQKKLHRH